MKMLKKSLVALALFGLSVGMTSAQTSGSCGANLTWSLTGSGNNLTLTISGTGAMTNYSIYTVVPWYSQHENIKTLVLTNGMTSIGSWAFYDCDGLTVVTIPSSVKNIAESFYDCSALTAINVDANNQHYSSDDGVLYNKNKTTLVKYPEGKTGTLTISGSITSIEGGALERCSGLTAINVDANNQNYSSDNGVLYNKNKTILQKCPAGKTGNYTIPNSVNRIEHSAFWRCSGLTGHLVIPNSVTFIGLSAFAHCSNLTEVTISNKVEIIPNQAFHCCSGLTSITIPNSVREIDFAFKDCTSVVTINISSSVQTINPRAFETSWSLTAINVDANNQNYSSENGVFFDKNKTIIFIYPAKKAGAYVIPNTVTKIQRDAFSYCRGLTELTIGNSVASIENYAFDYCSGLTKITNMNKYPQSVNSNIFYGVNLRSVTLVVPDCALEDYQSADVWSNFDTITGDEYLPCEGIKNGIETVTANNITIYPNPVKNQLRISNYELRESAYTIFNVAGQSVGANLCVRPNGAETIIDVSTLPSGVYFIKVGNEVGKFIKE